VIAPLQPPALHNLSAAVGWLELGNWQEANQELDNIAAELRAHPWVLLVRQQVFVKAEKWELACQIGKILVDVLPHEPGAWIGYAYALRRVPGGGIPKAKQILEKAKPQFPNEPTFAYNLACYHAQLGEIEQSRQLLEDAFSIGDAKKLKLQALDDPDLEPLWSQTARAKGK
jgi:predicted Zn-dependent protease